MDQSELTPSMRRFISAKFTEFLENARLDHNHPMRAFLEDCAVIVGDEGHPSVYVRDESGELVYPPKRIEQLKSDPRFIDSCPNPPKIARNNLDEIRDNFEQIARGEVEVVK